MVRDNGGQIVFDRAKEPSWIERFLGQLFGPETYESVQTINMLTGHVITNDKKVLPGDFLAQLSVLSELECLGLENTIIAQSDWRNISEFSRLWYVLLGSSNISDDGIKYVARLPELQDLSMPNAEGITEAALVSIAQSPKLNNLNIKYTKADTPEAIDAFRKLKPQCMVNGL